MANIWLTAGPGSATLTYWFPCPKSIESWQTETIEKALGGPVWDTGLGRFFARGLHKWG